MINGQGIDVHFTDITEKAGIKFKHVSSPEKKYIVESMSGGVALFDYDNDGKLDLFVSNYVDFDVNNLPEFGKGRTCQFKGIPVQCGPRGLKGAGDTLYHNNGDGTFTDVSKKAGVSDADGYYGLGVICSDFDGDGLVDIFVANDSTPNFLYHNNGDGTFKDIGFPAGVAVNENGSEQGSMGVTLGDYDHDGRLDLFITNFDDDYNTLYHNDGHGSFTDVSYVASIAAVSLPYVGWGNWFVDYEHAGWPDLLVVNGH